MKGFGYDKENVGEGEGENQRRLLVLDDRG